MMARLALASYHPDVLYICWFVLLTSLRRALQGECSHEGREQTPVIVSTDLMCAFQRGATLKAKDSYL